jgi:CBS domain-containing protein
MLTAADVMTSDVVSVEPDTPVRDIAELLYSRRISGVPVVENDQVIGIVSEGDLRTAIAKAVRQEHCAPAALIRSPAEGSQRIPSGWGRGG